MDYEDDSFLTVSLGRETLVPHPLQLRPRPLESGLHRTVISAKANHLKVDIRLARIVILINGTNLLSPQRRPAQTCPSPTWLLLPRPSRKPTLKPLAKRPVSSGSYLSVESSRSRVRCPNPPPLIRARHRSPKARRCLRKIFPLSHLNTSASHKSSAPSPGYRGSLVTRVPSSTRPRPQRRSLATRGFPCE